MIISQRIAKMHSEAVQSGTHTFSAFKLRRIKSLYFKHSKWMFGRILLSRKNESSIHLLVWLLFVSLILLTQLIYVLRVTRVFTFSRFRENANKLIMDSTVPHPSRFNN